MSALILKKRTPPFGPESNGTLMTPEEFDRADFDNDWVYELINGVLIVSPIPSKREADPNEELGYLLRRYREDHPQGGALDKTLQEQYVRTGNNRRRPDRSIWAGLGRNPRRHEVPTIIAEFVSGRKRDRELDYETKRDEYEEAGVQEYWVIDRFMRTMTVFIFRKGRARTKVVKQNQVYTTDLLPGFELRIARLFALADSWVDDEDD
jgi:Uma2 family endonuclease